MKARIKETGEIVELAQEIRGHKGEAFQWFQIELIPELYDDFFDWQSFRVEAAKDVLCAMISNEGVADESNIDDFTKDNQVKDAVLYADKLISKLKEKEEK